MRHLQDTDPDVIASEYTLQRSHMQVADQCDDIAAIPPSHLSIIELQFVHEVERTYYEDLMMAARRIDHMPNFNELDVLNRARAACTAVKGHPSTKVICKTEKQCIQHTSTDLTFFLCRWTM